MEIKETLVKVEVNQQNGLAVEGWTTIEEYQGIVNFIVGRAYPNINVYQTDLEVNKGLANLQDITPSIRVTFNRGDLNAIPKIVDSCFVVTEEVVKMVFNDHIRQQAKNNLME